MRNEEQQGADASGEPPGAPSGASLLDAAMDAFAAGEPQASGSGRPVANRETPSFSAIEPQRDITRHVPLLSTSPGERREILAHMMASGIEQADVEAVARLLLADPDAETRWMAAEALARSQARLPLGVIQRALGDPQDRIGAVAVRLAARRGPASFPLLIPLMTQRRSPMTQTAALDALRRILEEEGHLSGGELRVLLTGIAAMDPPPLRVERPGLEGIARAIGTERLRGQLGGSEPERLGAARLLLAEASPAGLRSVSGLSEDPSEEVRRAAAAAIHLIGQYRGAGRPDAPAGVSSSSPAPWTLGSERIEEPDLIASLARALADPEAAVRSKASVALERLPRRMVADWAVEALEGGSADAATKAASVVEHLGVLQAAESLLKRASGLPGEARAPYLGALSALQLDPADLAALVPTVDPAHRQEAVRLSWQVGGRAVLPSLRPLLEDTAGPVRMAVMEVLAESGEPAAVEIAEDLLKNDSSAAVRATAVYILARSEPEKRLAALSRALMDPDPDVRATAVEALPGGLVSEMMELLLPALQDPDERVWQASLRHLAALPDHDLPLLWAALRESPPIKREELVRSIERSDPDRLSSVALQNVHALDPADRVLATQLAARAGTVEGTAAVAHRHAEGSRVEGAGDGRGGLDEVAFARRVPPVGRLPRLARPASSGGRCPGQDGSGGRGAPGRSCSGRRRGGSGCGGGTARADRRGPRLRRKALLRRPEGAAPGRAGAGSDGRVGGGGRPARSALRPRRADQGSCGDVARGNGRAARGQAAATHVPQRPGE